MADGKTAIEDWLDAPADAPLPRFESDQQINDFLDAPSDAPGVIPQRTVEDWLDTPEDTWSQLGLKIAKSAPALFKQSIAGAAQKIEEQPATSMGAPLIGPFADVANAITVLGRNWLSEKLGIDPNRGADQARQMYAEAVADIEENAPNVDPDSVKGYAYDAATSLIQMIPGVAATIATKRPSIGAAMIGTQVGTQQYGESRAEGRAPQEATQDMWVMGLAEGIPEMLPLGVLMKPGGKFLSRVLRTAGAEGATEVMTQAIQDGYSAGVLKEDMTWGQAMDNLKRAGILGATVGGTIAAGAHPFVRDRASALPPPSAPPAGDAAAAGAPSPEGGEPSPPSAAATKPPVEPPATSKLDAGTIVGVKMGADAAPVRAEIEGVQDGWVYWRDEAGNPRTDRETQFRRDLTATPPSRGRITAAEPSGALPAAPPPTEADINEFDPWANARPPKAGDMAVTIPGGQFAIDTPSRVTEITRERGRLLAALEGREGKIPLDQLRRAPAPPQPAAQGSMPLPRTEEIAKLRRAAGLWIQGAAEAQRILESGSPQAKTPQDIAAMRVEAAKLMDQATALERAVTPARASSDATAATPEQMAAKRLGPLGGAAPAKSEATTGPQTFPATQPLAAAPTAQPELAPVARSEAEAPPTAAPRPQAPQKTWQQRLREQIGTRKASLNDPIVMARNLGTTPEAVAQELQGIAAARGAPIETVRTQGAKNFGKWRYTPRPTGKAVEDLADFVLRMGGIRPSASFAGELQARDLDKINVPFKGKLVRPAARLSTEEMANAAMQEGFLVPTESGQTYAMSGEGVGTTSANVEAFIEMLDQNANKTRRHFRVGEEPTEGGMTVEQRKRERKQDAIRQLTALGFEPKGKTVEDLEAQLDQMLDAVGANEAIDALDFARTVEVTAVDSMSQEAQGALRQEARNDYPQEYDDAWYAAELAERPIAEGIPAAQPAADERLQAGRQQEGTQRAGTQGTAERTKSAEEAASEGGVEAKSGESEERARDHRDVTEDLVDHVNNGGTVAGWISERGKQTGNEYLAITTDDGSPILGVTSDQPNAVQYFPSDEQLNPTQAVNIIHNHPIETALSSYDMTSLNYPGTAFMIAVSRNGDVSGAALSTATRYSIFYKTKEEGERILTSLYSEAHNELQPAESNSDKRQELTMRALAAAGIIEYHSTHPITPDQLMQIRRVVLSLKRKARDEGVPAPKSRTDTRDRSTFYRRPADALAAISRRTAEIRSERQSDQARDDGGEPSNRPKGGPEDIRSGSIDAALRRQTATKSASGTDVLLLRPSTGVSRPSGLEEVSGLPADTASGSNRQARDRGYLRGQIPSSVRQRQESQQNTTFGIPISSIQSVGGQTTLSRLLTDESGALTAPDWNKIKAFFARGQKGQRQPTPQQIVNQAPKLGAPNRLRSFAKLGQWLRSGFSLASIDQPSSVYWNANLDQENTKNTLEREAIELARPYFRLDAKAKARIHKILEYARLYGIEIKPTGRDVVVRIPTNRPPFGEGRPELSRPGEVIALDETETKAFFALRKMFDQTLMNLGAAMAAERGYTGAFDRKSIEAAIKNAGHPTIKRRAEAALDALETVEDMRKIGYVPFQRYGDAWIMVEPRTPASGTPEISRFELVDTRSIFDSLFSRKGGRSTKPLSERMDELRQQYPEKDFKITHGEVTPNLFQQINLPALERALIAMDANNVTGKQQIVDNLMHEIFEKRKAGFRKKSQNVPGYSLDFERGISDYIRQTGAVSARMAHRADVDSAYDATQRHPVKEVRDFWKNFKDHQESATDDFGMLRKIGFFMFLWGTPASAAVNLTQTPLVTMTQLGTWAGPRAAGLAHGAMMEALRKVKIGQEGSSLMSKEGLRNVARYSRGLVVDIGQIGKTDAEKAMLAQLDKEGILSPQIMEDFGAGKLSQGASSKLRPALKRLDRAYDIGASMFNATEVVNRVAAALAYFRAAQNAQLRQRMAEVYKNDENFREIVAREGLTPTAIARFGVNETQFIGGKMGRPAAARGFGALLFQFKNFVMNYLRLMHKNFRSMGPQGKLAGSFMLMSLFLIGGLAGIPFGEDTIKAYDFLYERATGIDPDIEWQIREFVKDHGFGEYGAEIATRGFAQDAFGIDMTRLGMGNLFPDNSVSSLMPIVTGTVGRLSEATDRWQTGQPVGAAAAMLGAIGGKGLQDIVKGTMVYPTEGISTKRGNWTVRPEDVTLADMTMRALGFQPTKATRASQAEYHAGRIANATQERRTKEVTKIARLIVNGMEATEAGDREAANDYYRQVEELYQDNVARLIDPDIPDWQKAKPASRQAIRQRIMSLVAPEIARIRRAGKMARPSLVESPFVQP